MGKVFIELIFDNDCPNVDVAREQLQKALQVLELPAEWTERDRNSKDSPSYAKQYGSPTILVNQKDVAGAAPQEANCCRVYSEDGNPFAKAPSVEMIVKSIETATPSPKCSNLPKTGFAAIPAIAISLLPIISCPACWPAYASLLAAFGISFFDYTPYVLPLLIGLLLLTVYGLAYKAKDRNGYKPLVLGLSGSLLVIIAKCCESNSLLLYLGASLLLVAVVWNLAPIRRNVCHR